MIARLLRKICFRQEGSAEVSFVSEAEEALEDIQRLPDISGEALSPPEGVLHDFKQVLETIGEENDHYEKPVVTSSPKKTRSVDEKENLEKTPTQKRECKNRGGVSKSSVMKNSSEILPERNCKSGLRL